MRLEFSVTGARVAGAWRGVQRAASVLVEEFTYSPQLPSNVGEKRPSSIEMTWIFPESDASYSRTSRPTRLTALPNAARSQTFSVNFSYSQNRSKVNEPTPVTRCHCLTASLPLPRLSR